MEMKRMNWCVMMCLLCTPALGVRIEVEHAVDSFSWIGHQAHAAAAVHQGLATQRPLKTVPDNASPYGEDNDTVPFFVPNDNGEGLRDLSLLEDGSEIAEALDMSLPGRDAVNVKTKPRKRDWKRAKRPELGLDEPPKDEFASLRKAKFAKLQEFSKWLRQRDDDTKMKGLKLVCNKAKEMIPGIEDLGNRKFVQALDNLGGHEWIKNVYVILKDDPAKQKLEVLKFLKDKHVVDDISARSLDGAPDRWDEVMVLGRKIQWTQIEELDSDGSLCSVNAKDPGTENEEGEAMTYFKDNRGRPLGKGAWGSVFKVWREGEGKYKALKAMRLFDATELKQIIQEFVIGSTMPDHPGLMKMHKMWIQHKGPHILVFVEMEFLEGQNLDWFIKTIANGEQRALQEDREMHMQFVIGSTFQILQGLSVLQSLKPPIVHLDLKPANVMVSQHGLVTLVDYGLSEPGIAQESSNESWIFPELRAEWGSRKQTSWFRAPEVWGELDLNARRYTPGRYDGKADVWSAGIMLYQMLADGKYPFDVRNMQNKSAWDVPAALQELEKGWGNQKVLRKQNNMKNELVEIWKERIPAHPEYAEIAEKMLDQMLENNVEDRPSADFMVKELAYIKDSEFTTSEGKGFPKEWFLP